jgi:hypothetical protein
MGFNDENNKEFIDMATETYSPFLKNYNVNNKSEICYLLYWGVIDRSDLAAYLAENAKNSPELRYEAAVLLTKIIGGAEEVKAAQSTLTYDDTASIPDSAKNYVAYVTSKSVMQGTGNNKFDPEMQVSRAQMSTMMYNAMRYMNMRTVNVTVTAVSGTGITATDESGASAKYTLASSNAIRLDGDDAVLSDVKAGMRLTLHLQNEEVRLAEGYSKIEEQSVGGQVVTTGTDANGQYIRVAVQDGNGATTNQTYYVPSNVVITLDGKSLPFSSIKNTYYAKIDYAGDNTATKIELETMTTTINGTLEALITEPASIVIKLGSGEIETYQMLDNVGVTRDDKAATLFDLVKGDKVAVTMDYYKVRKIAATGISSTAEGAIKELVFGDTSRLTVKSSGELYTANITDDTSITVDGTAADKYALRVGQNAKVIIDSSNATRITATSVVGPSQITGVIKSVNTAYSIVTLTDASTGKDTQVAIKSGCTFIDQTNSKITSISKLSSGDTVMALGNMSNGVYTVSTLIVVAQQK